MIGNARIQRREFSRMAVAGLAWASSGWVRAQPKPEKPRVSIALTGKSSLYHLPLTVAEQLGYFRQEGLEVEFTEVASGLRAFNAATGGTADVVNGSFEHLLALQSKAVPLQAFVLESAAPMVAMGVSTKSLADFQRVSQLKGKRIGVQAPGSMSHLVAARVLERAGVKPGEVDFVGVGTAQGALAAVRAGQVDGISHYDPVITMLEQKSELRLIGDTRNPKGTSELFGGVMPSSCLFAPVEFMQKHPATCQALANGLVRALVWLKAAGPRDIVRTVPEPYLYGDRALYLACYEKSRDTFVSDGLFPPDAVGTAIKAAARFDAEFKWDRIDPVKLATNDFARRAKQKFNA